MANGIIESFKVGSTLLAQRVVAMATSSAMTVEYPGGSTELPIGITTDTVLDTTSAIPVQLSGIAELFFNDTVTSGGFVGADTSGRGIPRSLALTSTAISSVAGVVGILVGETIGATGTISKVLIDRHIIRATA
jgi:hypothetical protein